MKTLGMSLNVDTIPQSLNIYSHTSIIHMQGVDINV